MKVEKQLKIIQKTVLTIAMIGLFTGCVTSSNIVKIGENKYHTTIIDKGGIFSPDGQLTGKAVEEANKFCAQQNKVSEVINLNITPEGPMQFEQTDYTFKCVSKK